MIRLARAGTVRNQLLPLSRFFRLGSISSAILVILHFAACSDAITPTAATGSSSNQSLATTENVVDATDFGVTPCQVPGCDPQEASQTDALHAAMRHFYDQGITGTVFIPAGEYAVDEALRFHAGVNLVGAGMGETIIRKVGNEANYVVGNPILHPGSTALDITVSDLTFDADRTRRAALGMSQVGAINIDADVSRLTLERIGARDATNSMILRRLKESVIQDSHIDQKTGHGIATGAEGLPVGEFRDVIIRNNRITNSTGGAGINLSRAANTVVQGNEIINVQQQADTYGGIRIPNGGEFNVVKDNYIEGYPRGLFVLSGAHDNIFQGNTVVDSRVHGMLIQAEGNKVVRNVFRQIDPSLNPEAVIRLASDPNQNASENNIVNNSIVTHDGFANIGIRVTGFTAPANGNRIINNRISTSGVPVSVEGQGTGNIVVAN
jgi:3-dehydroshikimate dehydratase